jgi:hypothetical protein
VVLDLPDHVAEELVEPAHVRLVEQLLQARDAQQVVAAEREALERPFEVVLEERGVGAVELVAGGGKQLRRSSSAIPSAADG